MNYLRQITSKLYSNQVLMFENNLISQQVQKELPPGYVLRPLNLNDSEKGKY